MTTRGNNDISYQLLNVVSAKSILNWLDDDYTPRKEILVEQAWHVLPVPDSINPMEAEWLAEAILDIGISEVTGISFQYQKSAHLEKIGVDRDSILGFCGMHSHEFVILTTPKLEFLYFEDQENRYHLLCGDQNFVEKSYRCTQETAKMMYLDNWVDNDFNSEAEKEFLIGIWEKYASE